MAKKENTVKAHIIPRNGTAADWTLVNPVLLAGELGVETDTGRFKFGNGANPWNELPYSGESGGGLTEIPVATENTVGGFKSNPNGDTGAVEILGDGTAQVDTVRYAESAGQATAANKLVAARTISLSGEASGSVATNFSNSPTIPVTLNVPVATEGRIGGIKSGPDEAGSVKVDQQGLAYVNSAIKLGTARTIALTGEVTGSTTFDGSKNVSISASIGTLAGLSLAARIITTTTATLSATDCVVFVKASTTDVMLPANPRAGQLLLIRNIANGSKTTLKVGNSNHYINDGLYNKKQSWAWSDSCFFILVWDATDLTWHGSYMRAN